MGNSKKDGVFISVVRIDSGALWDASDFRVQMRACRTRFGVLLRHDAEKCVRYWRFGRCCRIHICPAQSGCQHHMSQEPRAVHQENVLPGSMVAMHWRLGLPEKDAQ